MKKLVTLIVVTMEHEPYLIVCNPCDEQIVAAEEHILNKKGFRPKVSRPLNPNEYIPIIIYKHYGAIYKCPECEAHSGILAPQHPYNLNLFTHSYICSNKNKIPVEV